MTLGIVRFIDGTPIVFGDLLLSRLGAPAASPVLLPAYGDGRDFFGDSGLTLTGLAQKVVVIEKRMALAWAGSHLGARCAVARLREALKDPLLAPPDLSRLLADDEDLKTHPVDLIGLLQVDRGFYQFSAGDGCVGFGDPSDDRNAGFAVGTGIGVLPQLLDDLPQPSDFPQVADGSPANASQRMMSWITSLIGALLLEELHAGDAADSLRHLFGGGYELAYFGPNGFEKLDELTTIVWRVTISQTNKDVTVSALTPQFVLRQGYVQGTLLLRSMRPSGTVGEARLSLIDEQLHAVPPMLEGGQAVPSQAARQLSFESCYTSHAVLAETPLGVLVIQRIDYRPPHGAPVVRFAGTAMSIDAAHHKRLQTQALAEYYMALDAHEKREADAGGSTPV